MSNPPEKPITEYERYIRTPELLSLQKTELSCHDELAFQIVHQVEELWMKLAQHEQRQAARELDAGRLEEARVAVHRMYLLVELMSTQLRILETMSPRAYFTVRSQLGRGSGQESPGFNALLDTADELRQALLRLLRSREVDLLDLQRNPGKEPALFALTEAMVDYDQAFQHFRYRHLALVRRIIGGRTPSLKGAPAELLEHGVKQAFFPELWLVREALFRDYMPGPSLYGQGEG